MKIALYSDLHREIFLEDLVLSPIDVDLVILAGDIDSHTHGLTWAAQALRAWPSAPDVVYVAGNHEYYGAHLGLLAELRRPVWRDRGVHFLERETLERNGFRILGCTLWSGFDLDGAASMSVAMTAVQSAIDDYCVIGARGGQWLTPQNTQALHRTAVRWLDAELSRPFAGRTVVVTHFAPHRGCVAPPHENSDLSPYFVTDLSWLMEKHPISVWCHGHTHTNNDFMAANGCRVISNQRGYPGEVDRSGFRPDLVIEV